MRVPSGNTIVSFDNDPHCIPMLRIALVIWKAYVLVLQLSSSVLDWFVKNKTERNSSQSKVTIVYSKATSPYQFLNSNNCTISIIALLKGSLKDRIPLRGLFFYYCPPLSWIFQMLPKVTCAC